MITQRQLITKCELKNGVNTSEYAGRMKILCLRRIEKGNARKVFVFIATSFMISWLLSSINIAIDHHNRTQLSHCTISDDFLNEPISLSLSSHSPPPYCLYGMCFLCVLRLKCPEKSSRKIKKDSIELIDQP